MNRIYFNSTLRKSKVLIIRHIFAVFCLLLVFSFASSCLAQTQVQTENMPRFVSTKASSLNLRTGPSIKYPIEWVYQKSGLPLEVIAEFDNWRQVKDWDGTVGWIIRSGLSGKRFFRTLGQVSLRRASDENAIVFATIEAGTVGKILQCPKTNLAVCRVEIQGYQGWLNKGSIWGVYAGESLE